MIDDERECVWIEDDENSHAYDTGCGQGFYFAETSAVEAGVNYCHHCGKPAEIWKIVWNPKTDRCESVLERKAPTV